MEADGPSHKRRKLGTIRFGYKMFCSLEGYPYQAAIYYDRSRRPTETTLGEQVVVSFADSSQET